MTWSLQAFIIIYSYACQHRHTSLADPLCCTAVGWLEQSMLGTCQSLLDRGVKHIEIEQHVLRNSVDEWRKALFFTLLGLQTLPLMQAYK